MKKKPRHLRVVEDKSSATAALSPSREEPKKIITLAELSFLSEGIDFHHGMALRYQTMKKRINLSEAGADALLGLAATFVESLKELNHIDSLLDYLITVPQSKGQTMQIRSMRSRLTESKVIFDGAMEEVRGLTTVSGSNDKIRRTTKSPRKIIKGLHCGGDHTFQLKVLLKGSKPPIWRRLLVPGDITLAKLHSLIQRAMGWGNSHLHQFTIDDEIYGNKGLQFPHRDESKYKLDEVLTTLEKFSYTYDFGDNWEHQIQVESFEHERLDSPKCIGGKRACPPEDTGGIRRYNWMLEVLKEPKHPEFEFVRDWLGDNFAPDKMNNDK